MEVAPSPPVIPESLKKMAESLSGEPSSTSLTPSDPDGCNNNNNNGIGTLGLLDKAGATALHAPPSTEDLATPPPPTLQNSPPPASLQNHINGTQEEEDEDEADDRVNTPPNVLNTHSTGSDTVNTPPQIIMDTDDSPLLGTPSSSSHNFKSDDNLGTLQTQQSGANSPASLTSGSVSQPLTPGSSSVNRSPSQNSANLERSGPRSEEGIQCGECTKEFSTMQQYMGHSCSTSAAEVPPTTTTTTASKTDTDMTTKEENEDLLSEGESFDGKIVYNPDGSAYIIEGESDLSDSDSLIDLPQVEGSIVDQRGKVNTSTVQTFPQIANAFYIQRNPAAFYNTFYMFPPENRPRVEAPIMHSYRVYDLRSAKTKDNRSMPNNQDEENASMASSKETTEDECKPPKLRKMGFGPGQEVMTVPTKPILMCFICKLSFGYAKSFVAHAIGEHGMSLNDKEREIMSLKNASAIIQGVGKDKEPLMSFLEPNSPPQAGPLNEDRSGAQPFFPQNVFANSTSSNVATSTTSVSHVYPTANSTSKTEPTSSNNSSFKSSNDLGCDPSVGTAQDNVSEIVLQQGASNAADVPSLSEIDSNKCKQQLKLPDSSYLVKSKDSNSVCSSQDGGDAQGDLDSGAMEKNNHEHMSRRNGSPNTDQYREALSRVAPSPQRPVGSPGRATPGMASSPRATTPMSSAAITSAAQVPIQQVMSQRLPSPNSMPGMIVRGCADHPNGNPENDCAQCDVVLRSRSLGGHMTMMHSRNSCKTLKCPKCNWHYKYQETLEIHMKEKHPETDAQCIYCIAGQPHPRLARGEVYTCGYKPYRCDVCNYSTTTKGNLSIHMQSDKHINNIQELQNGNAEMKMAPQAQGVQQSPLPQHPQHPQHPQPQIPQSPLSQSQQDILKKNKPKPTWRCDVCNYETNVARNLRIHMTSEKHTHNMMVLQQNVKHMQRDMQFQLGQMAVMGHDPTMLGMTSPLAPGLPPFGLEQAMFMPPIPGIVEMPMDLTKENNFPNTSALPLDLKAAAAVTAVATSTEPSKIFQCSICNVFSSNSLEGLHQHMQLDRTKAVNNDSIAVMNGTYLCNLCTYKTNLKANFQLHCKTDKHLQRLQLINHIREGGAQNEWRLKYMNMSNPVQVKCNACDYYTNSIHKLQLHMANTRHEANAKLFRHLQNSESKVSSEKKYYHCALCNFSTKAKLNLIQHVRSMKHMRNESMRLLQLKEQGKEAEYDLEEIFCVKEYSDADAINFDETDGESEVPDGMAEGDAKPQLDPALHDALLQQASAGVLEPTQQSQSIPPLQQAPISKTPGGGPNTTTSNTSTSPAEVPIAMCPYCNFSTISQERMQAHVVSAHGQRPQLRCPLCQESCRSKELLKNHLVQVHNVTQEGLNRLLVMVDQPDVMAPPSNSGGNGNSQQQQPQQQAAPPQQHQPQAPMTPSPSTPRATTPVSAATPPSGALTPIEDIPEVKADLAAGDAIKITDDGTESDKGDPYDDQYRCQTCSKTFSNIDALYLHQNELGHLELKQTPRGPGYLCWKKGCNQYFKTAHALQVHFREIHAKRQQLAVSERHVYKYRCNQCSLAFKTLEKLQLHSHYHLIRAATKCNICGRSFRSIGALRKHVESTHLDQMSEEELEQYRASLATAPPLNMFGSALTDVNDTDMKDEEQPMDEDEDSLNSIDKMEGYHNDSKSNGEIPLDGLEGMDGDQQCLEDYFNSQAIAEDSYNDPTRKYKCHRCKVAFTKQNYLTAHNKTLMHRKGDKLSYPMEKYLDPNRPYKCDTCKESFTQKNILLVHFNSVSHLHKLKQQASQGEGGVSSSSPVSKTQTSPQTVVSPGSSQSVTSPQNNTTSSPNSSMSSPVSNNNNNNVDNEKKPYKCNICRVAYSQGSTLDIHIRSVLHQTRASKLQELALNGQVDLTQPLIEQPEMNASHKKVLAEMLQQKQGMDSLMTSTSTSQPSNTPSSMASPGSMTSPSPTQHPSAPATPQPSKTPQPQPQSQSSQQAMFNCQRCNSIFVSQDALLHHQQMYCFSNQAQQQPQQQQSSQQQQQSSQQQQQTQVRYIARFKPQLHRNLLENIGFECVMQFNEFNQMIKKEEKEEATPNGTEEEKPKVEEEPDQEEEMKTDENKENEEVKEEESKADLPEINKCLCNTCGKEFSSIWVLKAHQEEVHRQVVPIELVESFSQKFKESYEKKQPQPEPAQPPPSPSTSQNTAAPEKEQRPLSENREQKIPEAIRKNMETEMPQLAGSQADFAAAQLAQMMQIPMFPMMPMQMINMQMAMSMAPPLMPMVMPMGHEAMFSMPGMQNLSMMDPGYLAQQQKQLSNQQQSSAAAAAAAAAAQSKRARTRISDEQLKILRANFDINNSPSEEQIQDMSEKSGLPAKVIKHWFRNTLFKERQRNKDSPYNFSVPPATTLNLEEYERTGRIDNEQDQLTPNVKQEGNPEEAIKNDSHKKDNPRTENLGNPHPQPQGNPNPHHGNPQNQKVSDSDIKMKPIIEVKPENYTTNVQLKDREGPVRPQSSLSESSRSRTPSTSAPSTPLAATPSATHTEIVSALTANPSSFVPPLLDRKPPEMMTSTPISIASPFSPHFSMAHHRPPAPPHPSVTSPMPNHMTPSPHQKSPQQPTKRANRTRFTDYQIKVLQEYFEQNAYPKDDDLDHLSKLLNLSPRVIVVWFQNARQKARKNYENQPPIDMSDGEGGGQRYQRTPGLNYQCKKCLTVFQRYYELIKHQKTHCFKDPPKPSTEESSNDSLASSGTSISASQPNDTTIKRESEALSRSSVTGESSKKTETEYRCDKCNLVFARFELWREHQNIHAMNPNLFPSFAPESAFAMLQNVAQQQIQQAVHLQQNPGQHLKPLQQHSPRAMSSTPTSLDSSMEEPRTPVKRKLEDDLDDSRDQHEQPRDKRLRTTILPEQLDYLYQKYQIDCNPSRKQLETIAAEVGLKKRVVQVWFQNTRARERKGQYRAHQQLIHKRCPFCRALFRARSALESHLATKHPEEMAKGDVNIDSIPDATMDGMTPPRSTTPVSMTTTPPSASSSSSTPDMKMMGLHGGASSLDLNKLMANPYNMPSPFMPYMPPTSLGFPSPNPSDPVQMNMKRLYEDSLKKYLDELSSASHKMPPGTSGSEMSVSTKMSASQGGNPTSSKPQVSTSTVKHESTEDAPLDLSKPIKVSIDTDRSFDGPSTDLSERSHSSEDRRISLDDSRSESYSESTENNDLNDLNDSTHGDSSTYSGPSSPNMSSGTPSSQKPQTQGPMSNKRFRTQMTNVQVKVMKTLFTDYKTPTMAECEMLGKEIGLPKRVVQVWFQNARAKEKKSKLNYAKTFGTEVDFSSRPPEECKLCSFKYTHKYTIQDHIFTRKHIDAVRAYIGTQSDSGDNYIDPSTINHLMRQREMEQAQKSWPGAAPPPTPTGVGADVSTLAAHPHLAQLHAMGLQAISMPGPMAALNPSASPQVKKEERSDSTPKPTESIAKVEVKQEPRDSTGEEKSKTSKEPIMSVTSAAQLMSPFGGSGGVTPSQADMNAAAAAGLLPYMYPGMGGFYPGMGVPGMMPGIMPGPENMFMYDPSTFGTPLTLLQIPAQAIADVQSKLSEPNATIAHYTQDCQALSDLKHMVGSTDVAVAREATVDVGYICKKCHMVYPGRDACLAHQQQLCYQGKYLDPNKSILKLEQIQYKCGACRDKFSTLAEYKSHCGTDQHRAAATKYLATKLAAKANNSSTTPSSSRTVTPSVVDAQVSKPRTVVAGHDKDTKVTGDDAATPATTPLPPPPPPPPSSTTTTTSNRTVEGSPTLTTTASSTPIVPEPEPLLPQSNSEHSSSESHSSPPAKVDMPATAAGDEAEDDTTVVQDGPEEESEREGSSTAPAEVESKNITSPSNRSEEPEPMEQD